MSDPNATANQGATQSPNYSQTKREPAEWDNFVKTNLVNFLVSEGLESIKVKDGCGQTGTITIGKSGEYKIKMEYEETM